MHRLNTFTSWVLAPATDEAPRAHAVGATVLRVLLGLLWAYNVAWKRPPDFGRDGGSGLFKYTSYAVSDPVFPPFSWVVDHVVLNAFGVFGWAVLVVETVLAVLLLTGAWVRLAALLGIAQSAAIGLSVAFAPAEWPWSYWLMIGAHVLLLVSASGRFGAVDAVRAGVARPRTLAQVWGVGAVVVGLYSVVRSFGDPLAARGPGLRSTDLSVSLGEYNLAGGAVLIVSGALLLVAARTDGAIFARIAAVLAALGALSLHAQIGFSDPVLGGTAVSAVFLFSIAVVAAATVPRQRRTSTSDSGFRSSAGTSAPWAG